MRRPPAFGFEIGGRGLWLGWNFSGGRLWMEGFCQGFNVEKNRLLGLSFRYGLKVEYSEGKFA